MFTRIVIMMIVLIAIMTLASAEEAEDEITTTECELCHGTGFSGSECLNPRQLEKIDLFEKTTRKHIVISAILIIVALLLGDMLNLLANKATKEEIRKRLKLYVVASVVIGCISAIITLLIALLGD